MLVSIFVIVHNFYFSINNSTKYIISFSLYGIKVIFLHSFKYFFVFFLDIMDENFNVED